MKMAQIGVWDCDMNPMKSFALEANPPTNTFLLGRRSEGLDSRRVRFISKYIPDNNSLFVHSYCI